MISNSRVLMLNWFRWVLSCSKPAVELPHLHAFLSDVEVQQCLLGYLAGRYQERRVPLGSGYYLFHRAFHAYLPLYISMNNGFSFIRIEFRRKYASVINRRHQLWLRSYTCHHGSLRPLLQLTTSFKRVCHATHEAIRTDCMASRI